MLDRSCSAPTHASALLLQGTLLAELAQGLRDGSHDGDRDQQWVWELYKSTGARAALREARKSLRGSIRSARWAKVGGSQVNQPIATILDQSLLHVSMMEVAIETIAASDDPVEESATPAPNNYVRMQPNCSRRTRPHSTNSPGTRPTTESPTFMS